jgi:hypothetical protein
MLRSGYSALAAPQKKSDKTPRINKALPVFLTADIPFSPFYLVFDFDGVYQSGLSASTKAILRPHWDFCLGGNIFHQP